MTLKTPHTIAVAAVALRAASRASGRQAEWPQLGIGFGVVFALGLVLAPRAGVNSLTASPCSVHDERSPK